MIGVVGHAEAIRGADAREREVRPARAVEPALVFDREGVRVGRGATVGARSNGLLEQPVQVRVGRAVGERERRAALILDRTAELQATGLGDFRRTRQRQDVRPILSKDCPEGDT